MDCQEIRGDLRATVARRAPTKKGRVTVKHPDKDIPRKTLASIERQSGLLFR